MLRGPKIDTVIPRFFAENPRIQSKDTRRVWSLIFRGLESRYPDKRVGEYTAEDIRDFVLFDAAGQPKAISSGSIKTRRTALISFFSWAAYVGLVKTDPRASLLRMLDVTVRPVRAHTWLTEEEINLLFRTCYTDPHLMGRRDGVVIGLALMMGLRRFEIAQADWGDLNLRAGTLSVMGKGAKLAQQPVPKDLVEMLFEWQAIYAAGLGRPVERTDPVVISFQHRGGFNDQTAENVPQWGKRSTPSGVYTFIKRRALQFGLPELAPHDLRRSYAGLLEDKGVPLREIQHALRHSSISTTERYLADNPKKWRDNVAGALDGINLRAAQ